LNTILLALKELKEEKVLELNCTESFFVIWFPKLDDELFGICYKSVKQLNSKKTLKDFLKSGSMEFL
jgi:hypothetical protein